MKQLKLLVLKGLPASGKTTYAREWVNEDPKNRVRVNRDDIRRMLGPYWVPQREDLVTRIETTNISISLGAGYSVVVDATNFRGLDRFEDIIKYINLINEDSVIMEEKFFDVSVEECIKRDSKRPKEEQVGEQVIINFAKKYLDYEE